MSPTDPTPDVGALAREIDRLTHRVGEWEPTVERVGELDQAVGDLGETLGRVIDRLRGIDDTRPAASWLLLSDPDKAEALLEDLVQWLDAVYLRYPGVQLPPCWAWHPWVIEELWWLRTAHADAYAARVWGAHAGMWHDQQRPRVVERIQKALGSCDLGKHRPGGAAACSPVAAPLAGHMRAVAAAWTSQGLPPEPSAEQIADAQAYDDAKLHPPVH